MIPVRAAVDLDAGSMATLLNAVIERGGTTALTKPVTAQHMRDWMSATPDRSAWHVALDDRERVIGFQWIGPNDSLPENAADIATFVEIGRTGLGIGSALFSATAKAAKAFGYVWINATIRADNEGGLVYYQSRGFRDWAHDTNITLDNGLIVDKIRKRYDL